MNDLESRCLNMRKSSLSKQFLTFNYGKSVDPRTLLLAPKNYTLPGPRTFTTPIVPTSAVTQFASNF
jgi:hypothetical protein